MLYTHAKIDSRYLAGILLAAWSSNTSINSILKTISHRGQERNEQKFVIVILVQITQRLTIEGNIHQTKISHGAKKTDNVSLRCGSRE